MAHKKNPYRAAREAAGLTREVAAVRAGVSLTTLRTAEWGGPISDVTAAKLAKLLGVKPAALLGANAETRR